MNIWFKATNVNLGCILQLGPATMIPMTRSYQAAGRVIGVHVSLRFTSLFVGRAKSNSSRASSGIKTGDAQHDFWLEMARMST